VVDPAEDLVAAFMTGPAPSGAFDVPGQLESLVCSSIVD